MLRKLIIRMNKPFDYGDVLAIARAEAQKKEHTRRNIKIKDVVCNQAEYIVYYEVQEALV